MINNKKFFNILNSIVTLLYFIIMIYIYRGFYYPDVTIFGINPIVNIVSLAVKILFPILIISGFLIYYGIQQSKIKFSSVMLLGLTITILLAVSYPILDFFYKKKFLIDLEKYHTFLQLKPKGIQKLNSDYFNIICLGGSTTEFKNSTGESWPSQVEYKLNKKLKSDKIRVFNQGRQWYTTQHSLINYLQNLRILKPDLIIIMHNINDLLMNADFSRFSNGEFRDDYGHFLGPGAFLLKYPNLLSFLIESLKLLWYQNEIEEINTESFPGLNSFERNIKTIIEVAKIENTKVVLMTQPNLYKDSITAEEKKSLNMLISEAIGNGKKWSYRTALSGIRQYNNKIREIAIKENIPIIDLDRLIPKTLEYFWDDVHYTDKSFPIISTVISDSLAGIIGMNY